jgi:hypothetical protein
VAIDLSTGAWGILDDAKSKGVCREVRRVPVSHLVTAMRGYVREIETALVQAGADPKNSYSLDLNRDGGAVVISKNPAGGNYEAPLPPFPITTPLQRIEVTLLNGSGAATQAPKNPEYHDLEPL